MMIITRAASHRSRKIRPRPPEVGATLSGMTDAPSVAKRILATTMVRGLSGYARHTQIFPCYHLHLMTQKSLGARLSKGWKGGFNHEPGRGDYRCCGARRLDQG